MHSVEIRVVANCPVETVFATYTQPEAFGWCSYIRKATWARGKPWEVNSRLLIQAENPSGGKIDQVLMHFEPERRVDFISHYAGITLQSRIMFLAMSDRQSEIHAHLEFVGVFSRMAGLAMEKLVERKTRQLLEELARTAESFVEPTLRAAGQS